MQIAFLKKELRTTWIIIENSIVKAFQYMVIPFMFAVNFALCRLINDEEDYPETKRFAEIILEEYQQIFGENMEDLYQ